MTYTFAFPVSDQASVGKPNKRRRVNPSMIFPAQLTEGVFAACVGLLAFTQDILPLPEGLFKDATGVSILALLVFQLVRQLVAKNASSSPDDLHLVHDRITENMAAEISALSRKHDDPRSGFSTMFLDEKVERLIDLQEEANRLNKSIADSISKIEQRGTK